LITEWERSSDAPSRSALTTKDARETSNGSISLSQGASLKRGLPAASGKAASKKVKRATVKKKSTLEGKETAKHPDPSTILIPKKKKRTQPHHAISLKKRRRECEFGAARPSGIEEARLRGLCSRLKRGEALVFLLQVKRAGSAGKVRPKLASKGHFEGYDLTVKEERPKNRGLVKP